LEAKTAVVFLGCRRGVTVKPGYESVESVEHVVLGLGIYSYLDYCLLVFLSGQSGSS
jgi:hypothetical protein